MRGCSPPTQTHTRDSVADTSAHTSTSHRMDSNTGANDMKCKKCDRLQAEVYELWRYRKRAEKAERERDQARASAYNWEATAGEWEKRALAAESRPLTPDAITDEMVRRGAQVATPAGVRY